MLCGYSVVFYITLFTVSDKLWVSDKFWVSDVFFFTVIGC